MTEEAYKALLALAKLPIEDLAGDTTDDSIIFMIDKYELRVGHVRDARSALEELSYGPGEWL